MFKSLALALTLVIGVPALAHEHQDNDDEHRKGESHEHGYATVQMSLDDNDLDIHIFGAAQTFVNFEYEAQTKEEKSALALMDKYTKDGNLVSLNKEASCILKESDFDFDTHEDHANIEIDLEYQCENPDKLTEIAFNFSVLKYMEKLKAEYIGSQGQPLSAILTLEDNILRLK